MRGAYDEFSSRIGETPWSDRTKSWREHVNFWRTQLWSCDESCSVGTETPVIDAWKPYMATLPEMPLGLSVGVTRKEPYRCRPNLRPLDGKLHWRTLDPNKE